MRTIKQSIIIKASPHDVYEALLDSSKHSTFTGSKAKISRQVNGKFTAYDGYASGINLDLIENKKIIQTWRASDWPSNHYSKITIILSKVKDGTKLSFTQE